MCKWITDKLRAWLEAKCPPLATATRARIVAYNDRLNELEVSPTGQDYNNILDILGI